MIPRREFITLLGGAAAWPLVARAQQAGKPRKLRVMLIPNVALCALKQEAAGAH